MIFQLIISSTRLDEMLRHANEHVPLEACGLLAGKADRVEKVLFVQNQAQSSVRFVMDPYEQLRAFEWIESHGLELIGIFHSHPAGPETVSATDIAEVAYEVVQVICSRTDGNWKARAFWIENGQSSEVTLLVSNQ